MKVGKKPLNRSSSAITIFLKHVKIGFKLVLDVRGGTEVSDRGRDLELVSKSIITSYFPAGFSAGNEKGKWGSSSTTGL